MAPPPAAPRVHPVTNPTNQVIQNDTTGEVDFLRYDGNKLVASSSHDYGLGSDFKIVASGDFGAGNELVAQSKSTGQLDFLKVDANGNLTASFLTSVGVPTVHGGGFFGGNGNVLVSQLADGSIDFLQFDANHKLVGSDLVANSAGLPTLVGVGNAFGGEGAPQFSKLQGTNDSLITQLADGTLDAIGFSGSFADGSLKFSTSELLPQTTGVAKAVATNQQSATHSNTFGDGVQVYTQSSTGFDSLLLASGYNGDEGSLYASNNLQAFAGWNVVDGGAVAAGLTGYNTNAEFFL